MPEQSYLPDAGSLLSRMIGDKERLKAETGIDLSTVRSRFDKGGVLRVASGTWCKLAKAAGINPVLALLSLVGHRLNRPGKEHVDDEGVRAEINAGLSVLADHLKQKAAKVATKGTLTLADFPDAFQEPFVLVTGDRRETEGRKMTPADFGALSSSPADIRFVSHLQLPKNLSLITDKIFILAPFPELARRFANATLICVGSPATNHLARILNRYAFFRFNIAPFHLEMIEDIIREAWYKGARDARPSSSTETTPSSRPFFTAPRDVLKFDHEALRKLCEEREKQLRWQKYSVFGGGLIDPTYELQLRGQNIGEDRDFGIITLAQNPFRESNDGRYPALLLAGYHLPGTCYALHRAIWSEEGFQSHPLGGVIRVDLKPVAGKHWTDGTPQDFFPFYQRMEEFDAKWDDDSSYDLAALRERLEHLSQDTPRISYLSPEEARRLICFLDRLMDPEA